MIKICLPDLREEWRNTEPIQRDRKYKAEQVRDEKYNKLN